MSRPGTTVATYTVAGDVRRRLERFGFAVEKRPGFGRKAQMLRGEYRGAGRPVPPHPPRAAAVVGGGLAGAAVALSLARRGCSVELFEREPALGAGASGNDAGIVMPHVAFPHELMARWYRAGYLSMLSHWEELAQGSLTVRGARCGVARMASSERLERFYSALHAAGDDGDYIETVERHELGRLAGCELRSGGFFLPSAGWVCPRDVCAADVALAGARVIVHAARSCTALERTSGGWRILGGDGRTLGEYPLVILAGGAEVAAIRQARWLPLERVRGQVAVVPAASGAELRSVVCYDGYVVPLPGGRHLVGATYDHDLEESAPRLSDTEDLFARAQTWLPGRDGYSVSLAEPRVSFRMMSRDRLPFAGPLPDIELLGEWRPPYRNDDELRARVVPGVWVSVGHGSRGLVSSHLAAEIIASRLYHEPLPVERDLADAADPIRFALRKARRAELLDEATLSRFHVRSSAP